MSKGFKKATKAQAKARIALFGASGSGKTFSALRIAKGLGEKIAVIDSERGSASKYSDRFEFDAADLQDKTVEEYVEFIEMASGTYDVLIIDSLSHAWETLKDQVQKIADTSFGGNYWAAWSKGNPMQKRFIDAILDFPGHVIGTMRSATEWTTAKDKNGKTKPMRVGLTPEQGKGIEYEFDMLLELSIEHTANVIKDRTGKFQDKLIELPGEDLGKQISEWLSDGNPEPLMKNKILALLTILTSEISDVKKKTEYFQEIVLEANEGESHKIEKVADLSGDLLTKVFDIVKARHEDLKTEEK